jgi:thioredoxin 1
MSNWKLISILLAGVLGGCATPEYDPRPDAVAVPIPEIATMDDFNAQVSKAPGAVLVEFYKSPCAACEGIAPTIDRLASEYRGRAAFFRVDVGAARPIASAYEVHYAPTVLVFRDGRQVAGPFTGSQMEITYRQALDRALGK